MEEREDGVMSKKKEIEIAYRRGIRHGLVIASDMTKKQLRKAVDVSLDTRFDHKDCCLFSQEILAKVVRKRKEK